MGNNSNKAAIISLIIAILGVASYIASTMVVSYLETSTPGFFVYIFGLFGLGGVLALTGLILGIFGIRKKKLKALAIISIIICCLVLIVVIYSGIMMLFSFN